MGVLSGEVFRGKRFPYFPCYPVSSLSFTGFLWVCPRSICIVSTSQLQLLAANRAKAMTCRKSSEHVNQNLLVFFLPAVHLSSSSYTLICGNGASKLSIHAASRASLTSMTISLTRIWWYGNLSKRGTIKITDVPLKCRVRFLRLMRMTCSSW